MKYIKNYIYKMPSNLLRAKKESEQKLDVKMRQIKDFKRAFYRAEEYKSKEK